MRSLKSLLLSLILVGLLGALAGTSTAFAAEPWWSVSSGTAPGVLEPEQAKDEVQEVTVAATGGTFELRTQSPCCSGHQFAWNASHQVVQEGMEEMLGAGNVEVPRGQGNATGSEPYEVIYKGTLADRFFYRLEVFENNLSGEKDVTVTEPIRGRTDGKVVITAINMGDADLEGPITISDKLPKHLRPIKIEAKGGFLGFAEVQCTLETLSCVYSGVTPPYEQIQVFISVEVEKGAVSGEINEAIASGGNAQQAKYQRPITVSNSSAPAAYGVEQYEITPEEAGGGIDTQAGSHPFQLTTTLMLDQADIENPYNTQQLTQSPALAKDLHFKLPPGLIGNPTPFPRCRLPQFEKGENFVNECPDNTAVGVAAVTIEVPGLFPITTLTVPLFNLTPSVGEPARFGFEALGVPVFLDTAVRTGGDYGVTVTVSNITQTATFLGSRVTFWGVPGDPRHDNARGWSCIADDTWQGFLPEKIPPCAPLAQHVPPPFIELPTSCTGPLQTSIESDSWKQEGVYTTAGPTFPLPSLDGCNALPSTPSITVVPDGHDGSTASGLTVAVHVPQEVSLDAEGLSEADVKDTKVTLPAGVALNPAAGDGLLACSEAQIALEVHTLPTCPEASKVANVEVKTPLLPNALTGAVYLAAQEENPFHSLVALYMDFLDPVSGTLVKVAGEVTPDPLTGQLVATFNNTPQLPFEELKLHFFGGSRAPLATPALCGNYLSTASIEAWSQNPPVSSSSSFEINSGPNGSPCANPLPFSPSLTAGTTSIQAGGFSPFTMTMSRQDGEQSLQAVKLQMPPGLLGTLSTVKLCGEPQADEGTCGPESQIGETIVSVGVGDDPFSVTGGKVFITGPYNGSGPCTQGSPGCAPYGLSIVNPAKAGPFDLEKEKPCDCLVVRAKVEVDPISAQLTITTDNEGLYKIPSILKGIPLQIKHVNVTINRPDFTFNPTNCSKLAISGSLSSLQGSTAALSVPFQATNCAVLAFKPRLEASTSGKTSRTEGAGLNVKLSYPAGPYDANIAKVKVELPLRLPSRLSTLQKACTESVFTANPANCPVASRIGSAVATTPVLPVSLSGPAYFVSNGSAKFPELIIVLQGYGTTVYLHGETFISKAGITSSTFATIPDVPVGTFDLNLPQGPNSALAANGNLCQSKPVIPTQFIGQNGAELHESTKIAVTDCPKAKKSKHKKKSKKKK